MPLFANIFLGKPVLLFVLSTFNAWLLLIVVVTMILVAFWFFKSGLTSSESRNDALTRQLAVLQQQIEYASREEIKARAEATKATTAREKLLASISHEIRTPMNGILGMALLLEETDLNPDQREYIDTITSSGRILLNKVDEVMVNDMLDHSKINMQAAGPENKAIDLVNCIEEVLDIFAVKAADSNTNLLYEVAGDAPPQITADEKRLRQVLMNLVENVLDAAVQQIFIGVYFLKNEAHTISSIAFEVGNRRIGDITAIVQQLTSDNSLPEHTANDKAGMAFAIVKKLITEMKGQVRVSGEPGGNIVFSIPVSTTTQTGQSSTAFAMKGFEGRNVLVVNTNIIAAGILKNQLVQWQLKPTVAFSGRRALELLAKEYFDLVIADSEMAEMDGIELVKLIRATYPDTQVVLLNALHDDRYKLHEEIFGEISVVYKPVKQHVLFDHILTAFRHLKAGSSGQDISIKTLSVDFSKQYPLRILIAEDNQVNQKWATKILNKMGYQPAIAENGHAVLDMVGQSNYDLILMDVQMPEMDGLEATKMIRVCLDKQPVIIAMTANVMQGDRLACMKAGMDDYISKPVELVELVNMLEKWGLAIKEKKLLPQ